jgi:hypothetical protein
VDAALLLEMIERTFFAVSTDETRYNLNGVYFEPSAGNLRPAPRGSGGRAASWPASRIPASPAWSTPGCGTGQPYLALEHVEGQRVDEWCDARRLGVEARLRLFLEILDAVAHTHDRLVLHRRAPYFHNGSARNLATVVAFYDTRFALGLIARQKADLVAFLGSL